MAAGREHVIVLHGLALNRWWTAGLARHLQKGGYTVHNTSYPSRSLSFDEIVDTNIAPLVDSVPAQKVHFAVHSMGGILVRLYAQKYGAEKIGRVVMIGTPNSGSEVADMLRGLGLFKWYFGAVGQNLGTAREGIPLQIGPVPFECGVIAGTFRWLHYPLGEMARIPRPNDGIVSVESTKVAGMKDHTTVNSDHSMLVWNPDVWRLTENFLKLGAF